MGNNLYVRNYASDPEMWLTNELPSKRHGCFEFHKAGALLLTRWLVVCTSAILCTLSNHIKWLSSIFYQWELLYQLVEFRASRLHFFWDNVMLQEVGEGGIQTLVLLIREIRQCHWVTRLLTSAFRHTRNKIFSQNNNI